MGGEGCKLSLPVGEGGYMCSSRDLKSMLSLVK